MDRFLEESYLGDVFLFSSSFWVTEIFYIKQLTPLNYCVYHMHK